MTRAPLPAQLGRELLAFLVRRAGLLLPLSILSGLVFPALAEIVSPLLAPAIVALLVLAMVRVPWPEVGRLLRRPLFPALGAIWMLAALPLLVGGIGYASGMERPLAAATMIGASGPALMSGPSIAALLGLNSGLALVLAVSTLVLVPFTLPALAGLASHGAIAIPTLGLFLRSLLTVGGCLAAALVLRRAAGPARLERNGALLDGISVVILVLFAVGVMHGITQQFLDDPLLVLRYVAAAFLLNAGTQVASALLFFRVGFRDSLTVALIAGCRNTALFLAVIPPPIDPAIALFVAAAQLSLYILPFVFEPLYRALMRRQSRRAAG
jgi:BASS family bile acid:Na+ symporter